MQTYLLRIFFIRFPNENFSLLTTPVDTLKLAFVMTSWFKTFFRHCAFTSLFPSFMILSAIFNPFRSTTLSCSTSTLTPLFLQRLFPSFYIPTSAFQPSKSHIEHENFFGFSDKTCDYLWSQHLYLEGSTFT